MLLTIEPELDSTTVPDSSSYVGHFITSHFTLWADSFSSITTCLRI